MFEHFTTLEEIYSYKLALALTMEQGSIDALDTLEETAMRSELKDLFRDYAHATRHQVQNLERCFSLLDQNANDTPSAAAKGLNRETNALIAKTDSTLVDAVLLAGALEAAHHESAVYEILIIHAKALGMPGAVELLSENLLQEKDAIEKFRSAAEMVTRAYGQIQAEHAGEPEPIIQVPPFLPPGSI